MPVNPISPCRFHTILLAADFSEASRQAFRVACSLAQGDRTRLIVLHVVEQVHVAEQSVGFDERGVPVAIPAEQGAHREALLDRMRELYAPGAPLTAEYLVREGSPAEEVLRAAGETGCDLVIMGTHGRTGVRRLLMGSVAEAVLRRAHCPVLTVKPPADDDARADAAGVPVAVVG